MCRLFGMTAGHRPVTAEFWLLDAPDSLTAQSHREPDGTGLGWFGEEGRPHVDKQPIAAFDDRAFAAAARTVHARTFVGHVRFASTGALLVQNTHPFQMDGRLFAHNGALAGLPALEAQLGADGMALVRGDTDSERWFALITREIAAAGGDVAAGIARALDWVAENLPVLSLNFVLIDAGELWALRYPETHELHLLDRRPDRDAGPLDHRSSHGTRIRSSAAAELGTVVVATELMDDDPRWRAISSGELIHVGPDLTCSRTTIRTAPPAHPLSLEQLSPRARASQAER